jgi:hypothetical protein
MNDLLRGTMLALSLASATLSSRADESAERAEKASPEAVEAFATEAVSHLPAKLAGNTKLWRQVAPSVYWLLDAHAERIAGLPAADRDALPGRLATFIVDLREHFAGRVILGRGVDVTALLDPARGLDPLQVTTLAEAYGTTAKVLKQQEGMTRAEVADAFLAAASERAIAGSSATLIVLGHGLPREIQSYGIAVERLAEALTPETSPGHDLSHLTLIFDDCYSADFCLALGDELEKRAEGLGQSLVSLPALVAGTNRCRVGHADVGGKFVPHFWEEVIELCYIRTPRPDRITLGDVFGRIDNAMYGYGRQPLFQSGKISGYRLVQPDMVQDPVIFVPLSDDQRNELRQLLQLDQAAPLLPLLDIG